METRKPIRLITLLQQLVAETEKINIGRIYIAIVEETNKISFIVPAPANRTELIYKHLIRLAIKDHIHSGRSEESKIVLNDIITLLSDSEVTDL